MAPIPDEICSPLQVVDALLTQRMAALGPGATPPPEWGEREHFARALDLQNEQSFAQIPCINDVGLIETLPRFSLVRYRGLVQDIFEPEIYSALLEERACVEGGGAPPRLLATKYRECVDPAPGRTLVDLGRDGMGQRGACYCVPLPGEAPWARAAAAALAQAAGGPVPPNPPATPPTTAQKRSHPGEDVEMTPDEPRRQRSMATPSGAPSDPQPVGSPEKPPQQDANAGVARSADEFGLNFPIPSEERHGSGASTPCIVKLYDADAEAVRMCECIEIVGVLCINPEIADFDSTPLWDAGPGRDARHPSTALVPRLHAILMRKLPFQHPMFPFSQAWLTEARLAAEYQRQFGAPGALAAARDVAIRQLLPGLGGDALAAEYALMQLVSRAFDKYGDKLLGAWSLNLAKWPEGLPVQGFSQAAAELVPRSAHFCVTPETLGTQRWRPRKDFVANRLVAAQLQLAPGTLLVLDETQMAAGQVSAQGVQALKAIGTLVTQNNLTLDFMSYDVSIPLELSCILVSSGRSIIKDIDITLPLKPCASTGQAPQPAPLDAARFLIGLVTRCPRALTIPDDVANQFSTDFAALRQELHVAPEMAHVWMALARASCLIHGEDVLTKERWSAVLLLERERLCRCREHGMFEQQAAP